jgi:hypothetical protein
MNYVCYLCNEIICSELNENKILYTYAGYNMILCMRCSKICHNDEFINKMIKLKTKQDNVLKKYGNTIEKLDILKVLRDNFKDDEKLKTYTEEDIKKSLISMQRFNKENSIQIMLPDKNCYISRFKI